MVDLQSNVSPPPSNSLLLHHSLQCLSRRDFLGCRNYAVKAQESDPNIRADASQVLAVADVLHASERRLKNNRLDYYSILQISRTVSNDRRLIWDQFSKLVSLVNPKNNKFAFSTEAYGLLLEAWRLLSDPKKKAQYDIEIGDLPEVAEEVGVSDHGNGSGESSETFWTVCPFCYCMFEYEKVYEGCCLRCQNCKRGFHGVAISPPSPEIMVPGESRYYFCYGVFSVKYSEEENNANVNDVKKRKCGLDDHGVVDISDDDEGLASLNDDSSHSGNNGKSNDSSVDSKNGDDQDFVDDFWEEVLETENLGKHESEIGTTEVGVGQNLPKRIVKARARRRKNIKSVALKSNKMAGNPIKRAQTTELVGDDGDIAMGVAGSDVHVDKGKGIVNGEDENEVNAWHEDAHSGVVFTEVEDDVFDGLLCDW